MISKIEIKNFQSHKETSIDFESGVNSIIGASDKGKSAIIKALRWVVENRPLGDSFRSRWGGDTEVALTFLNDNERKIIYRVKTDKENLYCKGDHLLQYKAFGQDVPEDIQSIINFSEINLQRQFDSHFLLSQTAGEIARFFNKIGNLEIIDLALSEVNSRTEKLKREVSFSQEELEKSRVELGGYDWIEGAEKEFACIEDLESEISFLKKETEGLRSILKLFEENEAFKSDIDFYALRNSVKLLNEMVIEFKERNDEMLQLTRIIDTVKQNEKLKCEFNFFDLKNELAFIVKDKEDFCLFSKEIEELSLLISSATVEQKRMKDTSSLIDSLLKKRMEIRKGISVCPVCKNKMN